MHHPKSRLRFLYVLLLLGCLVTACTVSESTPTPSPPVSAPAIATPQRAPTIAAQRTPAPVDPFTPLEVVVRDQQNGDVLVCNPDSVCTFLIKNPLLTSLTSTDLYIASPATDTDNFPQLITRSWQSGQALFRIDDRETLFLRSIASFSGMVGASGLPLVSFSEIVYSENQAFSRLYAAHINALPSAESLLEMPLDQQSLALKPVAVNTTGNTLSGVWYTLQAWQVSGSDMVFPLTRGLYYLDASTREVRRILDASRSLQGFSPNHNLAASVQTEIDGDKSLQVYRISDQRILLFPLLPGSELGAGSAVFSPDGRTVAWLEASGSLNADPAAFDAVLRVGDLEKAAILHEVNLEAAAQASSWTSASFIQPAGWLDNSTLLLQVYSADWRQAQLVKLDANSSQLSSFCPGLFLGFIYP